MARERDGRADTTGPTNEVVKRVRTTFGEVADAFDDYLKKPAEQAVRGLKGMFEAINQGLAGLGASLAKFVQLSNPGAVQRFTLALRDMQAVMGQVLTPALEAVTRTTRQVADALASMSSQAKTLFSTLAVGGGAATAFGLAVAGLARLFGFAAGPLGVLAATLGFATAASGEGRKAVAAFAAGVGSLVQAVAGPVNAAFAAIGKAVMPVIESVGAVVGALGSLLAPVLQAAASLVQPLAAVFGVVATVLSPVVKLFAALAEVVGAFAEGGIKTITSALGSLLETIAGPLAEAAAKFASGIEFVIRKIREFVNEVREFFGLDPLYESKEGKSVGAAVRGGQIGDLQSFIRRAYESGASSQIGKVADPQLSALKSIDNKLDTLPEKIADAQAKRAGGGGVSRTAEGLAPRLPNPHELKGFGSAEDRRDTFRKLFN